LRIRRPIGVENRRRIYRFVEDSRCRWGVEDAALSSRDLFNGLLDVQLDLGIRSIELDVHADPQGGLYSEPGGYKAMATIGLRPNTAFDPRGVLQRPGFKVLHVPDWDFMSNCPTLRIALETLSRWSASHSGHFPILVRINIKEKTVPPIGDSYEPVQVPKFEPETWRALEQEILSVLGRDQLFVPREFGTAWPRIAALRDRVLFVLYGRGAAERYRAACGEDRILFTSFDPDRGGRFASISRKADPAAFRAPPGAFVFASAETYDTREARENDTSRRDAVFASDANLVITDFAIPDPRFSPYRVRFPKGRYIRPHPRRGTRDAD
jgi:hypothetical protein